MRRTYFSLGTLSLAAGLAGPAAAQIDYRNLDDHRPVAIEDAYPVERHAFELVLPYHFESEPDGATVHAIVPELVHGIVANGQIGVKAPVVTVAAGGARETGLAGLGVFALYNLNTEGSWLPALSLRGDLSLPFGALASDDARFALKAIATRSWGKTRAHINASWAFGSDGALSTFESADRWSAGLAVDRVALRRSLLLIGAIAASEAARGAPTEVNAALGFRLQWTPTVVLDAGVERRLRERVGPDIGLTVGLSHAFALRGLMPGGR